MADVFQMNVFQMKKKKDFSQLGTSRSLETVMIHLLSIWYTITSLIIFILLTSLPQPIDKQNQLQPSEQP